MTELHIIRASPVLRQAMRLNDLDLGLLATHLKLPEDSFWVDWLGDFHEAMEGKDLITILAEVKSAPPASWTEVEVIVQRGAEGRECLRMLRSSS